jgi:copper(I)-binding protein
MARRMKSLVPIMVIALTVAACGTPTVDNGSNAGNNQQAGVASDQPIVQLPVLAGRPGAAYFTIDVPADHGALVAVTSPQVGRIEMHETMQQGSMTSMRPAERLTPENGRLVLARGGRHLMLFDVSPQLVAGSRAELVLRFERGQTRTLETRVVTATDAHASH